MSDPRTRRDVARLAARLMYERTEKEYFTAKRKVARQLGLRSGTFFRDLPSNAEIREEIDLLARLHEGEGRDANLLAMRLTALRVLRLLEPFSPRLIGSVLTGHIRTGSDIDVHAFSDSTDAVVVCFEAAGYVCAVEHKRVVKHGEARVFTHLHLESPGPGAARFPVEVTLYPTDKRSYVFRSSITGRPIEKATEPQLGALLAAQHPGVDVDAELARIDAADADRYEHYALLLGPLQNVKQNPRHHPEGDALYHWLQVFQLAARLRPWDEEFLLAALLHDVGKAIDPRDHVHAGLAALGATITDRTRFLIEHHMDALHLYDGTLGERMVRRLRQHEDFDELMLLRELDTAGRKGGVIVPTIDEALDVTRGVAEEDYLA